MAGCGLRNHLPHGFCGGDAFGNKDPLRCLAVADGIIRALFGSLRHHPLVAVRGDGLQRGNALSVHQRHDNRTVGEALHAAVRLDAFFGQIGFITVRVFELAIGALCLKRALFADVVLRLAINVHCLPLHGCRGALNLRCRSDMAAV